MKSREGEIAQFGYTVLREAFAAEAVNKFQGYYLPWIREALENADDELLWRRPNEGVNSIGNLLLHLEGNVCQWMVHGLGGAEDKRDRDSEFEADLGPNRWELFERLEETVNQACEVIAQPRTDEAWMTRIKIQSYDTTPITAVIHVLEHFAYHTGQIVMLVKSATGRDLHFYDL